MAPFPPTRRLPFLSPRGCISARARAGAGSPMPETTSARRPVFALLLATSSLLWMVSAEVEAAEPGANAPASGRQGSIQPGCLGSGPRGVQNTVSLQQQLPLGDNAALRLADEWRGQSDLYFGILNGGPVSARSNPSGGNPTGPARAAEGLQNRLHLEVQGQGGGGLDQLREDYPNGDANGTVILERNWQYFSLGARLAVPLTTMGAQTIQGAVAGEAHVGYFPATNPANALLDQRLGLALPVCAEGQLHPTVIPTLYLVQTGSTKQLAANLSLGAHRGFTGGMFGVQLLGGMGWSDDAAISTDDGLTPSASVALSSLGVMRLPQTPQVRVHGRVTLALSSAPHEQDEAAAPPVLGAVFSPGLELRPSSQLRFGFGGNLGLQYLADDPEGGQTGGLSKTAGMDNYLMADFGRHLAGFLTLEMSLTQREASNGTYQASEMTLAWQAGLRGAF